MSTPAPSLDYSKVFLTYVSLLGNAEQTAIACDLDRDQVAALAVRDNWDAKVTALLQVKEKQGAEAFARELNRTANFVQALRCRNLLDQTLQFFTNEGGMDGSGRKVSFIDLMQQVGPKGNVNLSAKNVMDLTKAIETVHRMTYAALGDTAGERKASGKGEDKNSDDTNPAMSMVRALTALNACPGIGDALPPLTAGGDEEEPEDE
jgi:hypothetical protein